MARRLISLACLGALAVALTAVSLAWACAPGGDVHLSSSQGVPGTVVQISGHGFPADETIEIRWDDPDTGTLLTTVTGSQFSTQITIPQGANPQVHYIVAKSPSVLASAPYTVMAPAGPGPGDGGGGGGNGSSTPPAQTAQPSAGGKTITGTRRADVLVGTAFADVINCGAGNDRVKAGGGNDVVNCGPGRDRVNGGAGNDRISGGSGNDRLTGATGNDHLLGGRGNDRLLGGTGTDRLFGNRGRDVLYRDGTDHLKGGPGRDRSISIDLAGAANLSW